MRLYLAARFSRRDELRGYANDLRDRGFIVDARWLQLGRDVTTESAIETYGMDRMRNVVGPAEGRAGSGASGEHLPHGRMGSARSTHGVRRPSPLLSDWRLDFKWLQTDRVAQATWGDHERRLL